MVNSCPQNLFTCSLLPLNQSLSTAFKAPVILHMPSCLDPPHPPSAFQRPYCNSSSAFSTPPPVPIPYSPLSIHICLWNSLFHFVSQPDSSNLYLHIPLGSHSCGFWHRLGLKAYLLCSKISGASL